MAKNEAPGCAGTTCNDDTCLACQVAQAKNAHADVMAALKSLDGHIADISVSIDALRKAYVGGGGPGAKTESGIAAVRPPPKSDPTPEKKPAAPAPEEAKEKLTIDNVRPRVLEWIKAHGRDQFVAVLAKFGAAKLPDVKEADLPALLAALDAVK